MPRFPDSASHLHAIPAAAYSALAGRLARHPGETYPLHVGDTWMEPAERCRMEDLTVAAHPGMHRYAPVQGLPALVDAVLERERNEGLALEIGRNIHLNFMPFTEIAYVSDAPDGDLVLAP